MSNYEENPIKFQPNKDNTHYNTDNRTDRPAGAPKSSKNFKHLLDSDDQDDDSNDRVTAQSGEGDAIEGDALLAAVASSTKGKRTPSLFDLTGAPQGAKSAPGALNKETEEAMTAFVSRPATSSKTDSKTGAPLLTDSDDVATALPEEAKASKLLAGQPAISTKDERQSKNDTPSSPISYFSTMPKEKAPSRFDTAQNDLSTINPIANASQPMATTQVVSAEKPTIPKVDLQAIINQLVQGVQEVKQDGKTETIITLNHPPLFAGANLVVTGFDNAKGEFNLSFENLTQAAKNMLDLGANRDALMTSLINQGYTVHILSATTLMEHKPIETAPPSSADNRQQSRGGDDRGDRGDQQDKRQRG